MSKAQKSRFSVTWDLLKNPTVGNTLCFVLPQAPISATTLFGNFPTSSISLLHIFFSYRQQFEATAPFSFINSSWFVCAFPGSLLSYSPSRSLFPGRQLDKIKAEAQERGDLGLVAESSRSNQRMMFQPASLTAGGVFRKLKEIASMSGNSVSHREAFSLRRSSTDCFHSADLTAGNGARKRQANLIVY